jgi:hypothetical protein
MTGKKLTDVEKLSMLDDAVIEALLADRADHVPDVEGAAVAAGVRSRIAAAKVVVGKRRLAQARAAMAADRARPRLVVSNPDAGARALRVIRAADPALDRKMTRAARNERTGSEADETGIEEDLAELQAWEHEDGGD